MSTVTTPTPAESGGLAPDPAVVARKGSGAKKLPIIFGVISALLAIVLLRSGHTGDTTFQLSAETDFVTLPDIVVPSMLTAWLMVLVCVALTAESVRRMLAHTPQPIWIPIAFALAWMTGFLSWAAADERIRVVSLFAGAVALAIPLIFGALGGVLGERAGVVNIAIDGQLLFGAFAAAIAASTTGSPWAGLVAAAVAGALVALVLGLFAITYLVDQVIVGVVLNVLVIGLTNFLFRQVLTPNAQTLNAPEGFNRLPIPILGEIPLVGPIFFRQTALVYVLYAVVALVAFGLYRTRWGLRVRAVGEHPKAADTVGIKVNLTRYRTILLAGAIAGMGGAYYTLVSVNQFNRELTSGAGYIALAAVIFGKWDPIRATLAALLFGFATNLGGVLSAIGSPVPTQFMLMLPYLVTIFAVAGLVGRSRPPAAVGIPYQQQ
ncbi:simple sugar transport system permease protein [Nocardioides alpinus]|uniref:Simple sugar transport system permease protein n=1 Tax=Nocardioides alpinus TaxID=748909 RepID=A0A1I1ABC8_9ACTN|nr:ABC transporter permease [Nocardioides alpinus]SFB35267.1 simple sugar transport system permease protein [Nocardioides alpinus]